MLLKYLKIPTSFDHAFKEDQGERINYNLILRLVSIKLVIYTKEKLAFNILIHNY